MLNFYRILLTFFNIVLFFIGISYVVVSRDMVESQAKERPCPHENSRTILLMGASMVVMTSIGMLIACVHSRHLELFYKWALTGAAAAFFVFYTFITVLLPKPSAAIIFFMGTNTHWLPFFNPLLIAAMTNSLAWNHVKECYIESNICVMMGKQSNDEKDYMVEAGCCIPPNRCNMTQATITTWKPGPVPPKDDEECQKWMEPGLESCYDCPSCKAGYLNSFKLYWDESTGVQIIRMATLIIMASLTWVAFWEGPFDSRENQNQARLAKSYLNP